jgi:hypothetical protein
MFQKHRIPPRQTLSLAIVSKVSKMRRSRLATEVHPLALINKTAIRLIHYSQVSDSPSHDVAVIVGRCRQQYRQL